MAVKEINIGLDLGQKQDYTALSILGSAETDKPVRDLVTYEWKRDRVIRLIHMERISLGTSYPGVIERIRKLLQMPALKRLYAGRPCNRCWRPRRGFAPAQRA